MSDKKILPESQKPIVQTFYPHMLSEDTETWTRFLRSEQIKFSAVWYDIHVGKGLSVADYEPEYIKKVASGVYQKRIDVIAQNESNFYVIEIKPFGNMVALGQALSYARLFGDEYQVEGKILPAICCLNVDNDILDDIQRFGIKLFMP